MHADGGFLCLYGALAALLLRHGHADALGQFMYRIDEAQALIFDQEPQRRAVRATTETMVL